MTKSEGDEFDPVDGPDSKPEHRGINRIPVRLAVSRKGRSAPLGRTRDISLHGAFIETREPFDVGTILPLVIRLGARSDVPVQAEVVRVTDEGMGLRFHRVEKDGSRRLRRWVVDHTSVSGSRRQVEQLMDSSTRIRPIREPDRILALLADIVASKADVTLVPVDRVARDYARIVRVEGARVRLRARARSELSPGDEVHALLTLAFVSYAFGVRVVEVSGPDVVCEVPERIVFSERRVRERRPAPPGSTLTLPAPLPGAPALVLEVVDLSDDGLACRAPPGLLLTPGTRLDGARLEVDGRVSSVARAEVRNVFPEPGGVGTRVGVLIGRPRAGPSRSHGTSRSGTSAVGRLLGRVKAAMSVVFHKSREHLGTEPQTTIARRVTVRAQGLPIRGLLDRSTETTDKLRCPLVIVIPGFAGRKEQLSLLAGILLEGFRRQNADIAVLRIDTTNNLGESGKDPGFDKDGMHCMHHTISGVVDDIRATLAWSRANPFVQPSHVILVSMSLSAVGARHVLTLPEASDVGLWVSYMGAADAIDTIRNASGNIDFHEYWRRGDRVGYISVNGVLTDGDHFWSDCVEGGLGDLTAAQREMANIGADVVWLRGQWDAFVDPRRVDAIMGVESRGAREIIDVPGGHLPRTSEEALRQFVGLTRRIWRHVHTADMPAFQPNTGRLVARHDAEWAAVRRDSLGDRADWWKQYLLDATGPGFDVVEHAPEYRAFMDLQADLAVAGEATPAVLELGAGTGNLTRRLVAVGAEVTATDLVPEALTAIAAKVASSAGAVATQVLDLDGSPWTAMARFLRGDLSGVAELATRLPGVLQRDVEAWANISPELLHASLRGFDVDLSPNARPRSIDSRAWERLQEVSAFARHVAGRGPLPPSAHRYGWDAGPRGLPFPDGSFDAVAMSLVLSYVAHPEDCLSEIHRVLRPGGRFVCSSMVRDADSSRMYLDLIGRLEAAPATMFGSTPDEAELAREQLKDAARRFAGQAAELYRIEEEGLFRFYAGHELRQAVAYRGFVHPSVSYSFGSPPQAVIVSCTRP